jgi:hypothetical protein
MYKLILLHIKHVTTLADKYAVKTYRYEPQFWIINDDKIVIYVSLFDIEKFHITSEIPHTPES